MEEKILAAMREVLEDENVDTACAQDNCEAWDSLRHLNLIAELEDVFNVEFEPEEIAEMKSFSAIHRAVKSKLR